MARHPADEPGDEDRRDVFDAIVERAPEREHDDWLARWEAACNVEGRRRRYDAAWAESLRGITTFGQ
jgi:hypothetical protein